MNQKEELILKILSSVDVIQGKTKFVKILHFTCKLFEENKKESPFNFRPDNFGVYTTDFEPVLQNLESQRLIRINKSLISKRVDFSLMNDFSQFQNNDILDLSPRIDDLVNALNPYSGDDVVAFSYYFFPQTTENSKIKPKVNQKITELLSPLSLDFEESFEEKPEMESILSETKDVYPQFNDMDARIHMMKSLDLKKLPVINPESIEQSTGLLAKRHPFFKKYDLEKMLEDARRR